MESLHVAWRRL